MVTDIGGLGDKSFNDLSWAGLEKAKTDLGAGEAHVNTTRGFEECVVNKANNVKVIVNCNRDLWDA